jgi:serine/threonine-protein kinase RsbW
MRRTRWPLFRPAVFVESAAARSAKNDGMPPLERSQPTSNHLDPGRGRQHFISCLASARSRVEDPAAAGRQLMTSESWTWTTERVIPSQRGAGREIIDNVLEQLQHQKWSQRDVFSVRLALEEAICNAISHGNCLDCNKQVHFHCRISPTRFWAQIADEGNGFDPNAVPDCTDPDHLEVPGGRGVMLIKSFMNRVCYNDIGNIVEMEKFRSPCEADGSCCQ